MKYKAILVGALVRPRDGKGGDPLPWQLLSPSRQECIGLGQAVLEGLDSADQKKAYVKVVEVREVLLAEVHVAVEQPQDKDGKVTGPLAFAIAWHNDAKPTDTTVART